jgi:hypothetical protein
MRIMNRLAVVALAALATCCSNGSSQSRVPQQTATPTPAIATTTIADPLVYLVQSGPNGLLKSSDLLTVRRRDWPAPGWEASKSALLPDGRVLQTFSFTPWQAYTPANGDGGQIAEVGSDGYVRFTETRDGGKPYLQCFRGGTGWLVFGRDVPTGSWKEVVATLAGVDCRSTAPYGLVPALTR